MNSKLMFLVVLAVVVLSLVLLPLQALADGERALKSDEVGFNRVGLDEEGIGIRFINPAFRVFPRVFPRPFGFRAIGIGEGFFDD